MDESKRPVERTWDGEPISPDPPFGAVIVVFRLDEDEPTFLLLHRGQFGPSFDGDWAWGPPSGARYPDENIDVCAARELAEETGFTLPLTCISGGLDTWCVYIAEQPEAMSPQLSVEHDRYTWLRLDDAVRRISPEVVRAQLTAAAAALQDRTWANHLEHRG